MLSIIKKNTQKLSLKMKKKIQTKTDYYIEFSEEELAELGFEPGQKFSIKKAESRVELIPYAEIEIDLSGWSREVLEMLIDESCRKDVSVNEVIEDVLRKSLGNELE